MDNQSTQLEGSNSKNNKKFTILIFFILIFSYWVFWSPGQKVANDYHLPHIIPLQEQILPWIWRETNVGDGLGEYTGITLWSQPLHSFFSMFSALSISPSLQTKFLGSLVFIIGFFSMSKLLQLLKIRAAAKYVGILFYLTSSYFILLFDGGQLSLALSYAFAPLVVYLFLKTIEESSFRYKLYLVVSILFISILDIRFIYLLFILLFLAFLFQLLFEPSSKRLRLVKNALLSGILGITTLIGFHLYWILPSILVKSPQLPQTYERASQVDFLSFSSVGHSLMSQQPHWYKNIFGQVSDLRFEFIFIPILVLLAPILRRKSKVVGFWLLIAALGIFLSKGSQEPFGQVYPWLFAHIPLFSLFRDPTKFYLYISLSYSILIAVTIQELSLLKYKFLGSILKLTPYICLIYFLYLMRPVYLNQMTGMFSQPVFEKDHAKLTEYLKKDSNYSRVFWIPTKAPLGYVSDLHPAVEATRLSQKRPFAVGIKGSYETFNFLREAPYMGQIFDVAGIGYISYSQLDQRRDDIHPDNIRYYHTFSKQLAERFWLSKIDAIQSSFYQVNEHQDKFFLTQNLWWVLGSDSIYNEATSSAKLNLSKNTLIFAEEYPGLGRRLEELPEAKIVLNNKTIVDLAASFIDSSKLIFPSKSLDFHPDDSGWWKREATDLSHWREFLQTKYGIDNQDFDLGGGWAIGEGEKRYQVPSTKYQKGEVLLARVMESSRSGNLTFYQDNQLIGAVETKVDGGANMKWFEVGQILKDGGELEMVSLGDINVVNALVFLDKDKWLSYQDKAKSLQPRVVNFEEKNTYDNNHPLMTFQKVNPTKYIVTISNLTQGSFLVFSQNYDALWKINDQNSLPVYSLLNGFRIEKGGQYTIEFIAQKYVYIGLVVSGLTIMVLIFLLIRFRKRSS